MRSTSELNDLIGFQEVIAGNPYATESKTFEDLREFVGIFGRNENHEVNVFGEARGTVEGERVAADEKKLNFLREAQFDKLANVGVKSGLHRDKKVWRV